MSIHQLHSMTQGEFLRFSERMRHKLAARLLRSCHEKKENALWPLYQKLERWCEWPTVNPATFSDLSDRYHTHLERAGMSLKEHNLLSPIHQPDKPSSVPYLPIAIYLDNLRSAFNVGSVLRTTEAFRLGTLYFAEQTPFIDNPKVQKTSMHAYDKVPCVKLFNLQNLPRPWIALETAPEAPSVCAFSFPPSFTLFLGNEEYGINPSLLSQADHLITIPLHGFKHSLNVAAAYAITAATISHQLR